jgi:hypothetical protein
MLDIMPKPLLEVPEECLGRGWVEGVKEVK